LVDDVRRAYYAVLQMQSQLESQQQSILKYLQELQQLTNRLFTQQAVLEADRLRVRSELAKTSYHLAVTEDALADRRESLNNLLGRDLQTDEFHRGCGPRFWFSISPEAPQTNYAQVIVQVSDNEATPKLIGAIRNELNKQVPGAWITVRQLQTNPVETPVEFSFRVMRIPTANGERGYPIPSQDCVTGHGYRSPVAWDCRAKGRLRSRQPTGKD
jgi:hypothetical protein